MKRCTAPGKRVRGSLYVHRDACALLDASRRASLARAVGFAPGTPWNVARFGPRSICLLEYEDFGVATFPALLASTVVDLDNGLRASRDHRGAGNPPILHRKELMVRPDDRRRATWAALTRELELLGLFEDRHRIGRRRHWTAALARVGLDPEGRRP